MDDSITVSQVEKPKFADTKAWARFLQVFTLALGSGLMLAGVIFFFAYNWESLHRLVKLGMAVALILAVFSAVMTVKMKDITRKITVSALCGLVGVFWAIFGQAYQTKADSYVFFLTWAACILVWVFVADFYPLWAFFVALVSAGVVPFLDVGGWFTTLLMLYAVAWIVFFIFAPRFLPNFSAPPSRFITLLVAVEFCIAASVVCLVIVGMDQARNLLMAFVVVAAAIWYALGERNILLYSLLFVGALSVLQCLLTKLYFIKDFVFDIGFLFFNLVLMTGALVGSIFAIMTQNRKWKK